MACNTEYILRFKCIYKIIKVKVKYFSNGYLFFYKTNLLKILKILELTSIFEFLIFRIKSRSFKN